MSGGNERIWRCDLLPQYRTYKAEIDQAIQGVLESGRYTLAENVSAFEREFAAYVGCKFGVGVANATDGLTLAMKALGVGSGDEVITTPFTAIPTVSAIVNTGAKPVFVDVDAATYLIDLDRVPAAITDATKAVVPVHIFGNMVDIHKLRSMLPDHVRIVEDAAQAHGCKLGDRQAGSMGDVGVFSFYPTKNLGGYGDGGLISTNSQEIHDKLKLTGQYGMVDKDHIVVHGVNTRLDELQAAILRVKLKHLETMNQRRRDIAAKYFSGAKKDLITFQKISDNATCNYHVFAGRVDSSKRDALVAFLEDHRIQSNIYYVLPLHLQKANEGLGYKRRDLPVVEHLCSEAIALPMYPELPDAMLERVIATLNEFVT